MTQARAEVAQTHLQVLRLALPIIVSNLSVPLVGLVDTAVMGRLPDPAFIGAVALGSTIFAFVFWGFGFLRMGTTGLVAQAFGRINAGDSGQALRDLIARHLLLAMVFASAVLVMQYPIGLLATNLLPASEAVETAMLDYYGIRIWSAPAVLANYVMMGVFIGMQRTGFALVVQLVLNLSNVLLSAWLALHWQWGIEGVAWASVVAEYLAFGAALLLLRRQLNGPPGATPVSGVWPRRELLRLKSYAPLLAVNGNIFIRTMCLIIGFAWFSAQGARFGDVLLAVNAILMNLVQLLAYGLDGFAHAAEALVGSALGAGRRSAYRWAIRATTQWALITALGYSIAFALLADTLVAMLTTLEQVRIEAAAYTPWLILMPLISVWCYQLDGIFVGSLRTAQMRNAMLVATALYIVISLVTMALWKNHGLWLAMAAFYLLRTLTLAWYLKNRQPLAWAAKVSERE